MPWLAISWRRKFDLRGLVRTIAVSETYGLSSATVPGNERDTRLFSHQLPRPLTAHQMADALAQATAVRQSVFQNVARRAIDLTRPDVGQLDPRHVRPLRPNDRVRIDARAGPFAAAGTCS